MLLGEISMSTATMRRLMTTVLGGKAVLILLSRPAEPIRVQSSRHTSVRKRPDVSFVMMSDILNNDVNMNASLKLDLL